MTNEEKRTNADRVNDALVVTAYGLAAVGIYKFVTATGREARRIIEEKKAKKEVN